MGVKNRLVRRPSEGILKSSRFPVVDLRLVKETLSTLLGRGVRQNLSGFFEPRSRRASVRVP